MGFKKLFKIKPPEEDTPEKNTELLNEQGIPVKIQGSGNKQKFAAYGKFAADRRVDKVYAPPGYEQYSRPHQQGQDDETEGLDSLNKSQLDPYLPKTDAAYGNQDLYSLSNSRSSYSQVQSDPYSSNLSSKRADRPSTDPYCGNPTNFSQNNYRGVNTNSSGKNPYQNISSDSYGALASNKGGNIYAAMKSGTYGETNSSNRTISESSARGMHVSQPRGSFRPSQSGSHLDNDDDELDLNAEITPVDEDDLNNSIHDGYEDSMANEHKGFQTFEEIQREQELKQLQQEDEEVDEIKQEIRFTKQSSVASTRNTLKMAQDAEMAGMNTLGMLGHQSEKLNNVERNLNLMKMQNRVAEDKVGELKKLNRSILAVHVGNPFTNKRRIREAEERIKSQHKNDKTLQEEINSKLQQSTQRIENAMQSSESGVRERYQRAQALERAKKFQFENDEADDEMEVEIDRNLDRITQVSGRLKKLAIATGQEISSQKDRIKKIEENADDLDIRIHLNTTRMTNIR
ncbi:Sec9p Ecym_1413 [Eremothecium cymbalariae DBVPG|uniref:t-SNARE coiled-coil homology domain-containing protein n=1 Tax=Eremothecium cymbalariae (strain CBS 270.75 / DBVPG 7215 / KCTC 17166 / NRRL Y-17582) TaxID=931890 RepID=G8JM70_ERECY|nr:hypothetical protein Ecym_1413 [Eremothecium cymbalariae DBVPG\